MNCEICKKVFSGIECYNQHMASEKHRKKMKLVNCMSTITADVPSSNSNTGDQNVIQAAFPCTLCAVTFQTFSEFTQHAMSDDHARMVIMKNNTEVVLTENNNASFNDCCVVSTSQDSVSNSNFAETALWQCCKKCDKTFSGPEPYQQHIDSMAHKKKCGLLPIEGILAEIPPQTSYFFCKTCNVHSSGPEPYRDHISSIRHQKKASNASNVLAANSVLKTMGILKCEICDKIFTGPSCYEQHLESDAHKRVVDLNYQLKKMSDKENKSADSIPNPEYSEKPNGLVNPLGFYCALCDVRCSGLENLRQHNAGRPHIKKQMRAGAYSKQEELKSLFSGQTTYLDSFGQYSSKAGHTEIDGNYSGKVSSRVGQTEIGGNSSGNVSGYAEINGVRGIAAAEGIGQEIKNYVYGDKYDTKTCVPSDLNLTFFDVGEEIDFDKNSKFKIEVKDLDKVEIKEEENEEMEE